MNHPDLHWFPTGQLSLTGELLRLFKGLDREIVQLGNDLQPREFKFPIFIESKELSKLQYFKSFPHLVTVPVTLDENEDNLKAFSELDHNDQINLKNLSPIKEVLTPAACYHIYIQHQNTTSDAARYFTTMCPCFRREKFYEPLRRQWSFSMREIVIVGAQSDVHKFLSKYEAEIPEFAKSLGIKFEWTLATDPFFRPLEDPKYFAQVIDPVKKEMIFDGELSIGSLNYHRTYFGDTFKMWSAGQAAESACLAFGLERWIFALLKTHGTDSKKWPSSMKGLCDHGA